MDNLNSTKKILSKEDYNAVPVVYCKNCLSLKVLVLDDEMEYCDKCGCTITETTDITSWEKMYERKYGKPFNKK